MIKNLVEFSRIFIDDSKNISKIKLDEIANYGEIAVIDQSKSYIAGYVETDGYKVCKDTRIIFGDHTRIVKYVDVPFIAGADGVKILKLKDETKCLYKFYYYYLQYMDIPNTGYSRHFKYLKEKKFIIPSLDFQKEVVKQLDKIESLIKDKEHQRQKFAELIESKFYNIFGDLQKNSKNFPIVNLTDIAEYWNGLTYKPIDVSTEGTTVLRSSNIQDNSLDFNEIVKVNCDIKERYFVKENDILMCSRNGSAKLVGKVALIEKISEPMSFGAFMMIIRSKYCSYLYSYFQNSAFRSQIKNGTTATINQITRNMLNKIKLPLPPIELQKEYTIFMEKVKNQIFICNKQISKLIELKKSKMQDYFGGVINE